jgi:MYXO-CTERM domain-containing protein
VNNLIYDTHASGISLYRIDGGGPSTDNFVINNTIIVASDGRWALNIMDDSSGTTVYNNVLLNLHPSRGAISLCGPGCEADLVSDHNVVIDRFTRDDGTVIDLSAWQAATGQDQSSVVGDAATVFVDAAADDYHLAMNGPAVDSGTSMSAPSGDLEGNARPVGAGVDIGAYEQCGAACMPQGGAGGTSAAGEGGSGDDGGMSGSPMTGGAGGGVAAGGTGNVGAGGGAGGSTTSGGSGGALGSSAGNGSAGRPEGNGGSSGVPGTGTPPASEDDGGCSCRTAGHDGSSRSSLFVLSLLALVVSRRRGRSRVKR